MSDQKELLEMRSYTRENGIEGAPHIWLNKIMRAWLERKRAKQAKPKRKLIKRTSTLPNTPIPNQGTVPIPSSAKIPRFAMLGQLSGFVASALERILQTSFDPSEIRAGAQQVTDLFAASYGKRPSYADVIDAMPNARFKLSRHYMEPDLQRAETFLFDELKSRLGVTGVTDSDLKGRSYWPEIRRIRKDWKRKRQSSGSAAEVLRSIEQRSRPMKLGQDRQPIRDVVRRSVGLTEEAAIRPMNADKQIGIEIVTKPGGRVLYKLPDGAQFPDLPSAQRYLEATFDLSIKPPAKVT